MRPRILITLFLSAIVLRPFAGISAEKVPIISGGEPAVLTIRAAGEHAVRVTLQPEQLGSDLPVNPVLGERKYPRPTITLAHTSKPRNARVAGLRVRVDPNPLRVTVNSRDGTLIQQLTFHDDGSVSFALDDQPVLGMGEGGPRPGRGVNWRELPVEFDRRGRFHQMEPRWQANAYGSRNPVPLLIGTRGWGLYMASPWVRVDLQQPDAGRFLPVTPDNTTFEQQTTSNQGEHRGKGIPPKEAFVPGLIDVFVFDARDPEAFMRDLASIAGEAVMPPKWSLGYMQSHRTLEDDAQLVRIVDTFREKQIPLDAVIYLGTGFTPRGWNTRQPSFEFNPEVFKRDPAAVIADLHDRHVKVAVHMVPWDRDRLPTLQGSIPPADGEVVDSSHVADYWRQHLPLVEAGVDAWWPDEGDWFNLHERLKRHQLYYDGPISTQPDRRPWSLHRNGHLGIARWGGWVWSGDTESSWKTLEAQIAVGINHSLSIGPYWGSDIGGFYPKEELTGELYARWFQFGAFCPSFRAHGRTWWTRLPWGWGLDTLGPVESRETPLESELNNPEIEPIARRYAELRYQLLSYNYTLAWQARQTGLPFMRALWLHYPSDERAIERGDEYLWGRDLLIAPVHTKGATSRDVYLPSGGWYDWWTGEEHAGGRTVTRRVDLATMPIYVRAGAIVPMDPIRQFTGQKIDAPLSIRIYRGADGAFTLYEDGGDGFDYLEGGYVLTDFQWHDANATLKIKRRTGTRNTRVSPTQAMRIEVFPDRLIREVEITGRRLTLQLEPEP